MTANRWWVRQIAWWIAAVDGVSEQIRMFSLAVTAFSTFSILLQSFGLGRYVLPLGIVSMAVLVVYVYLYNAGGVRNQVSRDRQDLSANFAGPNARIQAELVSRSLAAATRGRELSAEERRAIEAELEETFDELRDGIPLDGDEMTAI